MTKKQIDRQQYDGRSFCFFPDTSSNDGSGIRVFPSGKKSFVLRYRFLGKKKYITYGTYRGDSACIRQAEIAKRRLLVDLDNGIDPSAQKAKKLYTVNEYCEVYLAKMKNKDRSPYTIRSHTLSHKGFKKTLGKKLMVEVKRADIQNLHDGLSKKKSSANLTICFLKAVFNEAERTGGVPEGHPNPCRGVKLYRVNSRTRYLNYEELGRLYKVLNALPENLIHLRHLISLYLQNGFRKHELLSLEWENVKLDGDNPHVYLPKTKNGHDHQIPLTPQAIEIFKEIPRVSHWVFPSPSHKTPTGHLANFQEHWYRIRKEADIEDVTIHDLRRTCGSILAQEGVSLELIQQILNHSNPEVTKVYARLAPKQIRDALSITGEKIDDLLNQDRIRLVG